MITVGPTMSTTPPSRLKFSDDDVDMQDYILPKHFNLDDVCHSITHGDGYVVLKNLFSHQDIEMALERLFSQQLQNTGKDDFMNTDDEHNNYSGLTWGLLSRGRVFVKMASHPVILEVAHALLGSQCRLSSLAANTVMPGILGQKPHLDYPYYRHLWPDKKGCMDLPPHHLLALQIVTLLTDFCPENGSTAIIPGSHINPQQPEDSREFFENAIQLTAKAGDVIMFAGPIQHCAMANTTDKFRCAILQHMVPLFVTPFEDLTSARETDEEPIRHLLALDHPHPVLKYKRKN